MPSGEKRAVDKREEAAEEGEEHDHKSPLVSLLDVLAGSIDGDLSCSPQVF